MVERTQTSFYIDEDLKVLVKSRGLNLTDWINTHLRKYLSFETRDDVIAEAQRLQKELEMCAHRLREFDEAKKPKDIEELSKKEALEALRDSYLRRRQGDTGELGLLDWIKSPSNLSRLKLLDTNPTQMLADLGEWYNGLQTNKD